MLRQIERLLATAADDDRPEDEHATRLLQDRHGHTLLVALGGFAQSHARYQRADRRLREASREAAAARAERSARLTELRHLVELIARDEIEAAPSGPSLPPLTIQCFGRFQVRRAGQPVQLCANRKGRAILRYLIAQPDRRATMDVLMELLWPGEPEAAARHRLHCGFSALRQSLNSGVAVQRGGGYLRCDGGVYGVSPEAEVQTDVEQFLSAYRAGRSASGARRAGHFAAACRLYTGPFLVEDLYVDWPALQREHLQRVYLTMCEDLAAHYIGAAQPEEAVGWALRILELNPSDEPAYRLLIRAQLQLGRREEALRLFRRCRVALAEELGVEPAAETAALLEAVTPEPALAGVEPA